MIHTGDCLEVMRTLPDASVDAVVTDPPYGLEFMGKGWDKFGSNGRDALRHKRRMDTAPDTEKGRPWASERKSYGSVNKNPRCKKCSRLKWDHEPRRCRCESPDWDMRIAESMRPYQQWCEAWGREALRVTVPGGYLLAFGGTRTHHRLVCGLEDAGWIIRDELTWVYASGFPKGKANLKPAHEPIVLARKPGPLQTLQIDATRIGTEEVVSRGGIAPGAHNLVGGPNLDREPTTATGRWPANVILTDPVFDGGVDGVVGGGASEGFSGGGVRNGGDGDWGSLHGDGKHSPYHGDSGTYSRFFLIPKADRADREPVLRGQLAEGEAAAYDHRPSGDINKRLNRVRQPVQRENAHPTVKPIELMRHLVRLVTPPGGTVLDPFLGSGTTAIAAEMEGFAWLGIEKELDYVKIAEARLNGVQRGMAL